MKPLIICIVGESGTGKTLIADYVQKKYDVPMIMSYTDRPKRSPNEGGHTFVTKEEYDEFKLEDMIAHTVFGEFRYCCLRQNVQPRNTYVIDEGGLTYLEYHFGDDYNIQSIRVRRNLDLRRASGITKDRIRRDEMKFMLETFNYQIENNGSIDRLFEQVDRIYQMILEGKYEQEEDFKIQE